MTVLAAVAAAGIVGVTGCGQPVDELAPGRPSGSTSPEPPPEVRREAATVRWADGYCRAVHELVRSMADMPTVDPSTPRRASRTSGELLDSLVDGLDRTTSALRALEPAPVPAGETVRADAVADYTDIRNRADQARRRLAAATDPAAASAALGEAGAPLEDVGKRGLLAGFADTPELARASQRAAACQWLVEQGPEPRLGPRRVEPAAAPAEPPPG
ncbi:hypothetical protein [Amycolatopsis arida]|nr:hypothetical protein [Amycolatopsis arida]